MCWHWTKALVQQILEECCVWGWGFVDYKDAFGSWNSMELEWLIPLTKFQSHIWFTEWKGRNPSNSVKFLKSQNLPFYGYPTEFIGIISFPPSLPPSPSLAFSSPSITLSFQIFLQFHFNSIKFHANFLQSQIPWWIPIPSNSIPRTNPP